MTTSHLLTGLGIASCVLRVPRSMDPLETKPRDNGVGFFLEWVVKEIASTQTHAGPLWAKASCIVGRDLLLVGRPSQVCT